MINLRGLALYGPLAASTRYRLGQFAPGLAKHGINLKVSGLLGDEYLRRRFEGRGLPLSSMIHAGAERWRQVHQIGDYDVAMVYCELFPFMPAWLERMLLRRPYLYDMDDAFYLRYQIGPKRLVRSLLGDKFDSLMAGAAAVTAGNTVLANYARGHNRTVTKLPTVVDTCRYVPDISRRGPDFTIGWIGSPSTATYLPGLVEPLSLLGAEGPLTFVVIGGKAPLIPNVNVIEIEWSEQTEVDLINTFDVGVMPLPDDAWARGKCAFKLIQYMACAVPVVASPVGANLDVVTADCGLLANTPQEWVSALRTLRDNRSARQRMGEAGRERVIEHFSLHTALPKLAEVIHKAAGRA